MSDTFELDGDNAAAEPRRPREERRARNEERDDRNDRDDRDPRGKGDVVPAGVLDLDALGDLDLRVRLGGVSDAHMSAAVEYWKSKSELGKAVSKGNKNDHLRDQFRLVVRKARSSNQSNALLFCLPLTDFSEDVVLYYALVFENNGAQQTRAFTDRNDSISSLILPEDTITPRWREQVAVDLKSMGKAIYVGGQVLLNLILKDITAKDENGVLQRIFDNAIDALMGFRENMLDARKGRRGAESSRLTPDSMGNKSRLETTYDFSGAFIRDSGGLPIRSDILGTLHYSRPDHDSDERDRNRDYVRTELAHLSAQVDAFYQPELEDDERDRGSRRGRRYRRSERDAKDPFMQIVVNINAIYPNPDAMIPMSLELFNLTLANVGGNISNKRRYAEALRPSGVQSNTFGHPRSLVDLGSQHLFNPDDPAILEDISRSMSDKELSDFLDCTYHQDIAFGFVLPSLGEKSWLLNVVEKIALAPIDTAESMRDMLYASADLVSGGLFKELAQERGLYERNFRPFRSTGTRHFLGIWNDDAGNVRPLSEWNVPALLSRAGAKQYEDAFDFQETFMDNGLSLERNLSDRFEFYRRWVPDFRVTNYAESILIDPVFLETLIDALDDANMSSYISSTDGLSERRRGRGTGFGTYATSSIGRERRRGRERDSRDGRRGGYSGDSFY